MEIASRFTLFTQFILEWADELLSKILDWIDGWIDGFMDDTP